MTFAQLLSMDPKLFWDVRRMNLPGLHRVPCSVEWGLGVATICYS